MLRARNAILKTRAYLPAATVLLISFAIKFAYLQERQELPDFSFPALDSRFHDEWAVGLATGQWTPEMAELKNAAYFRAPLYPYCVSLIYRLFGHSYHAWLSAQIVLGSASALLLFLLSLAVFGRPAAWVALGLYLGYWPTTYFEGERLIEVLAVFLDLGFLLAMVWAGRQKHSAGWIMPGLLLGLSAVARPNILIVVPFMVWWIYKRQETRDKRQETRDKRQETRDVPPPTAVRGRLRHLG